MNTLKNKLETLCVFRHFLSDSVFASLCGYLGTPTSAAYAAFVAALYEANGSSNVYVVSVGRQQDVPDYMYDALVADLTKDKLCGIMDYDCFLPGFVSGKLSIRDYYLHRSANIQKYGYGIYAKNRMFYVDAQDKIVPVHNPDRTELSQLVDYERERKIILDNTKALLDGKPAANILLTGDAGTGKSSTVKAVANALWQDGLRIIEIRKDQLRAIPAIPDELSVNPLKFVLFIDDLSFLKDDDNFNALKAVLEGSVTAKSSNVVICATSNRRHIIKEKFSDRGAMMYTVMTPYRN